MCSRICSSQQDIEALHARLKITACPHCKKVGHLIKRGFLRGYDQHHQLKKTVRAARVFCSNRSSAAGCGRTFSIWLAERIRRLFLSADCLWQFLSGTADSANKLQTFCRLQSGLSDAAPYHLWRRFLRAQPAIRTALSRYCEPPRMTAACPTQLTLAHLSKAFGEQKLSPVGNTLRCSHPSACGRGPGACAPCGILCPPASIVENLQTFCVHACLVFRFPAQGTAWTVEQAGFPWSA